MAEGLGTKVKVAINGLGTIGKRTADAVMIQPDMELVGVTAHSNNYRIQSAHVLKNVPIYSYAMRKKNADYEEMQRRGTQAAIDDLKAILDLPVGKRKLATEKIISRMNQLTSHLSANEFDEDARRFRESNIELAGGLDGDAMVLSSDPNVSPINRITWTPSPDGSVRQHWETSTDSGETWTTAFDGIYRKK